jgi:hypothetical protein
VTHPPQTYFLLSFWCLVAQWYMGMAVEAAATAAATAAVGRHDSSSSSSGPLVYTFTEGYGGVVPAAGLDQLQLQQEQ